VLIEAPQDQIEAWLRLLGCTPTATTDPQAKWNLSFDYPARSQHRMGVANPVAIPSAAVIAAGVILTPQHLQKFSSFDDDEKESFLWSLLQKANSPETDFQFFDVNERLDCPTRIQFSVVRYADGLTLDSFAHSVGAVFKIELATMWLVEEHLGGGGTDGGTGRRFDFKKLGL
jgi:hypothetical protein